MYASESTAEGSDRHQHLHLPISAGRKVGSGRLNVSSSSSSMTAACNSGRRKSVVGYHHHQQQQQLHQQQQQLLGSSENNSVCGGVEHHTPMSSSSTGGRYSPHPNELFLQHSTGKLSLQPIPDDTLSCCLPPPSPAPHNDRFSAASPSNGVDTSNPDCFISTPAHHHHHHHHQQLQSLSTSTSTSSLSTNSGSVGTQQQHNQHVSKFNLASSVASSRPMSPNRFRSSERLHSLKSNNLMTSNDYNYLGGAPTAHTPVKRYVPTPPPHDLYTSNEASTTTSKCSSTVSATQHLCTLPYRLRMKCCLNEQTGFLQPQAANQPEARSLSVTDYYTTSPRTRPYNKSGTGNGRESPAQEPQSLQLVNSVARSNVCTSTSPSKSGRQFISSAGISRSEYGGRAQSIEYFGNGSSNSNISGSSNGSRVLSPVLITAQMDSNTTANDGSASAATCLHCNTTRRTTGVHQTTQTTGPISPVPMQQQQPIGTSICLQEQVILTPATQETPLSPAFESQQQPQQQILRQQTQTAQVQTQASNEQPQQNLNQSALVQVPASSISQSQARFNPTTTAATTTCKKRLSQYLKREVARFFGVEINSEAEEFILWRSRQRRLALRRFGPLRTEREGGDSNDIYFHEQQNVNCNTQHHHQHAASERPDILPAQDTTTANCGLALSKVDFLAGDYVERKASVAKMVSSSVKYIIKAFNHNGGSLQSKSKLQWSRSFAPSHVRSVRDSSSLNGDGDDDENDGSLYESLSSLQEEEVFFDSPNLADNGTNNCGGQTTPNGQSMPAKMKQKVGANSDQQQHQIYISERNQGWRTSSIVANQQETQQQQQSTNVQQSPAGAPTPLQNGNSMRGVRISAQILDGVLENSRRPLILRHANRKYFTVGDLDDRTDHRPFFTYWINTVQILVLFLSLICYGIGPLGFGIEQRTGQVLVTSLSLQTVQHSEQRNIWIGPRDFDLVHMGAKFATCMRRDVKIIDVLFKTRRQERETACCIRNDDSGCVQSSQADCSVRGLYPTKSIATWKKWSPGESGPGGRISGSVCGLDPKYCDAPASIAPYEWPDDITKWPICRKANSFSQRFRFKDHTAEHMVCEVIGHPCCDGVYGECRITTREYCDFVNGYFHEEASLCSQISCLNNVCGMFPFFSVEVPDQFYRLFTSLCLHAGILHLMITVAFQHIFMADLERLIGPVRTAIVYIGSGIAGNLTSVLLVPYKPEVGPLPSLSGVVASLVVLLVLMHWKQLRKPHLALLKLTFIGALLFGLGTLPLQMNFAGLLAGTFCGVFLTIALVPFVSVNTYGRKSKINLIWTCVIFHFFVYALMLVIFYVFPTELTNLNFGEMLTNTFNTNIGPDNGGYNVDNGPNVASGIDVLSSRLQQDQQAIGSLRHFHKNLAALQDQNVTPFHRYYHSGNLNKVNNLRFSSNLNLESQLTLKSMEDEGKVNTTKFRVNFLMNKPNRKTNKNATISSFNSSTHHSTQSELSTAINDSINELSETQGLLR